MKLLAVLILGFYCCHASPLQGQAVDCDAEAVFNAVDLAIKAFNADRIYDGVFALSLVLDAIETSSTGQDFIVKYRLRETHCDAEEDIPWQKCTFMPALEGVSGECTAEVHVDDIPEFSTVSQKCGMTPAIETVTRSHARCLGCWKPIATDSLDLLPILKHAVQLYNNQSNKPHLFQYGTIIKAQRQVVAGWNYKFEYLVEETNCSKAEFTDLTPTCKAVPTGHVATCTVDAYVGLTQKLVNAEQKCIHLAQKNITASLTCRGCPKHISTDSPELKIPLAAALEKYNSECDDEFYYKIENITEATSQVVAGIMYRVHFKIKATNCLKAKFPKLNEDCHATEGGKLLHCSASIYERPWASEILPKVKCDEHPQKAVVPEEKESWKKPQVAQFFRRPPGFTPFRKATIVSNVTGSSHSPGLGHKYGHRNKPGHKKPKHKSSEESDEDKISVEIPDQLPNLEPHLEVSTRNPNEDLPSTQGGTEASLPLFVSLPDLPEPPAPKCPGTPWKPLVALKTPVQDPSHDFKLEDLLPPDEGTAEPLGTSAPNQPSQGFSDLDLSDAVAS